MWSWGSFLVPRGDVDPGGGVCRDMVTDPCECCTHGPFVVPPRDRVRGDRSQWIAVEHLLPMKLLSLMESKLLRLIADTSSGSIFTPPPHGWHPHVQLCAWGTSREAPAPALYSGAGDHPDVHGFWWVLEQPLQGCLLPSGVFVVFAMPPGCGVALDTVGQLWVSQVSQLSETQQDHQCPGLSHPPQPTGLLSWTRCFLVRVSPSTPTGTYRSPSHEPTQKRCLGHFMPRHFPSSYSCSDSEYL